MSGRLNSTGFVTMNLSESFRKGCWLGNGREITWKKQEEENGNYDGKDMIFFDERYSLEGQIHVDQGQGKRIRE